MKIKTRASPRIDKFWKQLSNKEKWRVPSRVVVFVCFFSTLWKSQNYSLILYLYVSPLRMRILTIMLITIIVQVFCRFVSSAALDTVSPQIG